METSPEQWIRFVTHGKRDERVHAEAQLLRLGEDLIPLLHHAIDDELRRTQGLILSYDPLLKLARFLAQCGDPRSLPRLLRVAQLQRQTLMSMDGFLEPLEILLVTLQTRTAADDCEALVDVLARFRSQPLIATQPDYLWAWSVQKVVLAIVRIAERDPRPELALALPLLKFPLFTTPKEFVGLHKRLKAALGNDSLPIPATNAPTTDTLPIPAEESAETPL